MFSRGGKRRPQALKVLAKRELGLDIQSGEHSSVDDARAALYLYHKAPFYLLNGQLMDPMDHVREHMRGTR